MIIDSLKNAKFYYGLGERVEKGLKFLENTDLSEYKNGKYEIDGEKVYVSVQDYETKLLEQGKFEAHRKYLDIQYIIKGSERLGFGKIGEFSPAVDYDEEKDIAFFQGEVEQLVKLYPGNCLVTFPEDLHQPKVRYDDNLVRKVVLKVKI